MCLAMAFRVSPFADFPLVFLQVVERFTGHGIGADMHMYPHVFHVPTGNRLLMQPGITFTIEPMVTAGVASPTLCPHTVCFTNTCYVKVHQTASFGTMAGAL